MTRIAIISRIPRPVMDDWNAWATPWKLVVTVAGTSVRAIWFISFTASPSGTPGFKLKDTVTAGNWPRWLTVRGPRVRVSLATSSSWTSLPDDDRTYSNFSRSGSV